MPTVSVIVPVYNVEKYLNRCLDSILNQTYTDFELLLVDDGSTDNSPAICDEYVKKDPRVSVIHKENGGLGSARNLRLPEAKGEYILFVDSDDYIEPDLLAGTVPLALEEHLDMVIYNCSAVNEAGEEMYEVRNDIYDKLILVHPCAWNKIVRKALILDNFPGGHLYPDRAWYEDLRGTCRLYYYVKSYKTIPDKYYNYVIHQGSIMRNNDAVRTVRDRLIAINEVYDFYKDKPEFESLKPELNWMILTHGFLDPTREIIHFNNYDSKLVKQLKQNVKAHNVSLKDAKKYIHVLVPKDRILLIALYFGAAPLLRKILLWRNNRGQ